MEIKKNISLSDLTTIKIGGPADYFFIVEDKDDLMKATSFAKSKRLPFSILGGGSNVLFSDNGYKGVVIKIKNIKFKIKNLEICAEAGAELKKLIEFAAGAGLVGLEWAAGIPGTVGGAIYGNSGAFGSAMENSVKEVEVFNANSGEIKNFSKKDCLFSDKETIFKKRKELIIVSAIFNLEKGNKDEIRKKIKENMDYRAKNHPLNFPSAGCAFKNYELEIRNQELLKNFLELEKFNERRIIPAAYLIDKCGLKGKKIGGAQISEKHANFIINLGDANASDVLGLIETAKKEVKNKFGADLEEEIQIIE